MKETLNLYSDGGSRGNPGHAASAFVAIVNDEVIYKDSIYLGVTTNNQAEYKGLILGLKWLNENYNNKDFEKINFYMDSELVIKQMLGSYRVKDEALLALYYEAKTLVDKFGQKINFIAVRREKNKLADKLVNETLDINTGL